MGSVSYTHPDVYKRQDVLSGEEEARLDFQGASFEKRMELGIMVDIGGGSTEIVSFEDGNIKDAVSLEIGSLYRCV